MDEGGDQTDKETARRVTTLRKYLERDDKPNDFFNFIVDPNSFTHSVENIFHFAFLIKDGLASLQVKDGVPVVEASQQPREQDYSTSTAERKQCIVKFDFDTWNVCF